MNIPAQPGFDLASTSFDTECSATLVIGWGSELRGDDRAGLEFVRRLQQQQLPEVALLETPQLTPELAWDIACSQRTIFVDAVVPGALAGITGAPVMQRMENSKLDCSTSRLIPSCVHSLCPARLLNLAQLLYGARTVGWLLYLPAESFDIGFELSALASRGIDTALNLIVPYLTPAHPVRQRNPP